MKITDKEKQWVRENYLKVAQMTEEQKKEFYSKVAEIADKEKAFDPFAKDLEEQKSLCKLLGFVRPGDKVD